MTAGQVYSTCCGRGCSPRVVNNMADKDDDDHVGTDRQMASCREPRRRVGEQAPSNRGR